MSEIARAARKASQPKPIGSSLDGMLTPVRAPQLWHILSVALIGTPQVLHFGMAKLSRAEQQPKEYGGQPAEIEYWAGKDEILSAAERAENVPSAAVSYLGSDAIDCPGHRRSRAARRAGA